MKLLFISLYSLLVFLVILTIVYVVHVNFFPVNVIFYSALLDVFISVAISSLILWRTSFTPLDTFARIQMMVILLLVGYSLAISLPTVIDRSLSFYILEKLYQRGGSIKLDRFEEVFTKEYMKEFRLVEVRITEQEESGTIVVKNGCVTLTDWGRALATVSQYFRRNLLAKNRLLGSHYTDDLTKPFENSSSQTWDYLCSPAQ